MTSYHENYPGYRLRSKNFPHLQVIRIQRLTSLKEDFEIRVKYLADILIKRGYNIRFLRKKFCQAIAKYTSDFQKWSLPQDVSLWFSQIVGSD